MRSYVVHTDAERASMLESMGLKSMDDLFAHIPGKLDRKLNLPPPMSELEVRRVFDAFKGDVTMQKSIFRGAGAYNHYIPAAAQSLAGQSAFLTAYTPYQTEMSQGMLQAIFEYQTLMCSITGMDVSNASVYDGATAAAEAMFMMSDIKRKKKVLISLGLHPDVLAVIGTYARFHGIKLVEVPLNSDGATNLRALESLGDDSAGFIAASPNFLGCIEDLGEISAIVHGFGGLMCAYVNPISLGLLARPGDVDCDIAVGDGQPLGLPLSFGGPYLGFMTAKQKYIRNLPGRIVGQTSDSEGNRTFVLTLQAREQHIRREKASSNICSNQMLCAIQASIYLSLMGADGLKQVATSCLQKAHYLSEGISHIKGMRLRYNTPFFNEFVVDSDICDDKLESGLAAKGILGGLPLGRVLPDARGTLYCVTECNTREELDELLNALEVIS